jgi:hypothetical protein
MDNGDSADFLLKYNDLLIRMEYGKDSGLLRILRGNVEIFRLNNAILDCNELLVPREMKGFVLEFHSRYRQASEIYKRIFAGQDQGLLPFPYVIREGLVDTKNFQSAYYQPSIPLISITEGKTLEMNSKKLSHGSKPFSFAFVYKTYLNNVGWCLASTSDEFLLLFTDGITVLVNGKTNMVGFHDPRGAFTKWFSIDDTLPIYAKKKLSFFPRFVQLLKSGQGHSFVS